MTRGCDLKSWKVTEDDGETIIDGQSHTYTYGDANWKDLLTAFDGHAITYDNAGNPTTYYDGSTMVWGEGRRLQSITKNGQTTSYQYDASGNRIRVTYPDGSYTKYCVLDGRVIGEIVYKSTSSGVQWSHGVRYIYGDDGSVVGFGIWDADTTDEWERYYFVKNLQGDVLKVYRDADNALVASYEYDPFGNILSATGEMADENPFRYRGYHYDTNTGFYYLQSRYYDPLICRFINADAYASTGQGVLGYNMFAYCGNNPVMRIDLTGHSWREFWEDVREWLEEKKEDAEKNGDGTVTFGATASGAFGFATSISVGYTVDAKGNIGSSSTISGGGGFPSAGVGLFIAGNNAPTIYHQGGMGTAVGASGGPAVFAIGGDYNMLIDKENGCTYHGGTVTASYGLYPTFVELHGEVGYTWVSGFNIYDRAIQIVDFLLSLGN